MANTKEKGRVTSPKSVELWDGPRATFRGDSGYVITVTDAEGVYSGCDLVSRLSGIVAARHGAAYLLDALRRKVSGATLSSDHIAG
jgi:hypothetical protein